MNLARDSKAVFIPIVITMHNSSEFCAVHWAIKVALEKLSSDPLGDRETEFILTDLLSLLDTLN